MTARDRPGFGPSVADEASQWRRAGPLPPAAGGAPRRESNFGAGGGSRYNEGPSPFDAMEVGEGGRRVGFGSQFAPGQGSNGPDGIGRRPSRFGDSGSMATAAVSGEPGPGDDAANWRTGKPVEAPVPSRGSFSREASSFSAAGGAATSRPGSGSRRESALDVDEKYAGLERMGMGSKGPVTSPSSPRPGADRKNSLLANPAAAAAAEEADTWRSSRKTTTSTSGEESSAPRERKRLELKPRGSTAGLTGDQVSSPTTSATPISPSKTKNPFGAAKPVDAAERERQVEEKLRVREKAWQEEREKKLADKKLAKEAAAEGETGKSQAGEINRSSGQDAAGSNNNSTAAAAAPGGSATQNARKASHPPTNPWKKVEPKSPKSSSSGPSSPAPTHGARRTSSAATQQGEKKSDAVAEVTKSAATNGDAKTQPQTAATSPRVAPAAVTGAWGGGRKASGALSAAQIAAAAKGQTEDSTKPNGAPASKASDAAVNETVDAVDAVEIKE